MSDILLAGDIGGTKTDLALYSRQAGPRRPLVQAEFHSADYASLGAMAQEFLAKNPMDVATACFDVAGPVVSGRAKITNLPWQMDETALAAELKLKSVRLMNDLEAEALAVPLLMPSDLHTLSPGRAAREGAIAVIAPGTGLGESFLTWDGSRYRAHASEGGHADFAPSDERQAKLLEYLSRSFDHVSWERVCSGLGIPHVYDFLRESDQADESPDLAAKLAAAHDRTPIIMNAALATGEPDALCALTLEIFVDTLAAATGDLALTVLATGGIYLGGGIPQHILPALETGRFLQRLQSKGRMSELITQMPVHVILCQAALLGAATYGLQLAQAS